MPENPSYPRPVAVGLSCPIYILRTLDPVKHTCVYSSSAVEDTDLQGTFRGQNGNASTVLIAFAFL